jgi:hypothetical protein
MWSIAMEGHICISIPESAKEVVNKWVNSKMMPTWRDRAVRRKEHEHREWVMWLAEVLYPTFPGLKGSIPEPRPPAYEGGEPFVWEQSPFTDDQISYSDMPEAARVLYDQFFSGGLPAPTTYSRTGNYLPFPPELLEPVMPPQFPFDSGATLWVATSRGEDPAWMLVDPKVSAALPVPRDPILVENERYFAKVWSALQEIVGPLNISETANDYGGIEPWYRFTVGSGTFTVGWRKRVVSVQVHSDSTFPTESIRPLALRDNTTYIATVPPRRVKPSDWPEPVSASDREVLNRIASPEDGCVDYQAAGWQSELPMVTDLTIHAWTQEKLVEYLTALCHIFHPGVQSERLIA